MIGVFKIMKYFDGVNERNSFSLSMLLDTSGYNRIVKGAEG